MNFRATLRYGDRYQRYHTMEVEAVSAGAALGAIASMIPDEIADLVDLVEVRRAVEPEERAYMEDEGTPSPGSGPPTSAS